MNIKSIIILIFCTLKISAQVSSSGCYISGALIDPGSITGCGNGSNYCNLASLYVPAFTPSACGTATSSGGTNNSKITSYILPAGCTATVEAEFRKRNYFGAPVNPSGNGCSNSGMDGSPDGLTIVQSGGVVIAQGSTINVNVGTCGLYPTLGTYTSAVSTVSPGCSNADGYVYMVLTGGSFSISGASNRADEIITFTVNLSGTCGSGCSNVLPISLTDFYGLSEPEAIRLNWKVATQLNTDYYLIEKSLDGNTWVTLNAVYAYRDITTNLTYQLFDNAPVTGINYYRLTDLDYDGTMHQHKIISINHKYKGKLIQAFDDGENIIIKTDRLVSEIELFDITGRLVKKVKTSGENPAVISKNEFAKGVYTITAAEGLQTAPVKLLIY